MAHSTDNSAPFQKETTFTSYSKDQGKKYAQTRLQYHLSVFQTVLDQHKATGGQFDTLLDVGCGPGNAARALAPNFTHVIGLDPSEGMIDTARSITEANPSTEHVNFEVSTAEGLGDNLSPPIAASSVDLIVAANAAHWFDLPRFVSPFT
jgi:SAM-dependent methyltransferase